MTSLMASGARQSQGCGRNAPVPCLAHCISVPTWWNSA